ncbi:MAG: indolepyruvate oxidoreductase subunit beta [Peptococcaceae bacterium]|nr:indolepyruvate oxidoreductase subunit beta [Peptococcaceae bacterium]
MNKVDIVIAGVGGQGNLLASRVLAWAAANAGWEIRTSEAIGMAQREGMVSSHVRMGKNLRGAIIPDHEADIVIGLELAETVRAMPKLRPGGLVLCSTTSIVPVAVTLGETTYDTACLKSYLEQCGERVVFVDATALARQAGNERAANTVMLGALSRFEDLLPFSGSELRDALMTIIRPQFKDVNSRAFELGQQAVEN